MLIVSVTADDTKLYGVAGGVPGLSDVSAAVTVKESVAGDPTSAPVLQYVMMPVVGLATAVPFVPWVTTVTVCGLAESPEPVSVDPVSGLIVVHCPADTLPV
jgi:hypothetical protein